MKIMPILFFSPVFKQRIWGSHYFKDKLGYKLDDSPYGEMWSLSAHKEGETIITNGEFKGKTLSEIFLSNKELFNVSGNEFPLMIKLLHTNDLLSVQVHPDDEFAEKYEHQLGKTECWYFLDATKDSSIVLGHNAKTIDEMKEAINEGKCENLLTYHSIKQNDFTLIPSKTVHALGKGLLLLEIQQSSDITYRLYDYNRMGLDGKKRELHVEKGLQVIEFPQKATPEISNFEGKDQAILTDNKYFKVELQKINDASTINFTNPVFHIISVAEGTIQVEDKTLNLGESFLTTADLSNITIKGNGTILITEAK